MATSPSGIMQASFAGYWKLFLYGPPGVGKSIMACTSQHMRTVVLDVDMGAKSVKNHILRYGLRQDLLTHYPCPTAQDFDAAMAWLIQNVTRFDLVVIDTFSELQRLTLKMLAENARRVINDQKDWGFALNRMDWYSSTLRAMPVHVAILCHDAYRYDEDLKRDVWRPDMRGQFAQNGGFAKHFDEIGRVVSMYVDGPPGADGQPTKQVMRAVQFGPDPGIIHKDRSGNLSQYEYAHIDSLVARVSAPPAAGSGQTNGG